MAEEHGVYIAHKSEDGIREETVCAHLHEVAEMASVFAREFGAEDWAYAAGILHDVGKYSADFQKRILQDGPLVDHSTAGAYVAAQKCSPLISYCIAGHHGGLPDGGVKGDIGKTLLGRFYKAQKKLIPDYSDFSKEVKVPAPLGTPFPIDRDRLREPDYINDIRFEQAFFVRMVFSCLVDADYLCTERFMQGAEREHFSDLSLSDMRDMLEERLQHFFPPKTRLNEIRCRVLDDCKKTATLEPGVFSLTVPTGGGKTYALMRFALHHATQPNHQFQRVICAEPYTSIIEQNADVYRQVFGDSSVLEHHSNYDFDDNENSESSGYGDKKMYRMRLASENWDVPLVVTTNVQLFESLYANKTSRCRKLHNIARSVIVLDEAQMIPTPYIAPCVKALSELVKHYGCSIVLCTATQPALNGLFLKEGLKVREIASQPEFLVDELRRVNYKSLGRLDDDELAARLSTCRQVLCVLNSRKHARILYDLVLDRGTLDCDSVFHLTTLMYPQHRSRVIEKIRMRLKERLPCIVLATSLVEAGVDLDFRAVYRAVSGIDSIVQAAGRCNREMRYTPEESTVFLFREDMSYSLPIDVRHRAEVARSVLPDIGNTDAHLDMDSLDVIEKYFTRLHHYGSLDNKDFVGRLSRWNTKTLSIPFAEVASDFNMVEDTTCSVIVPTETNRQEIDALMSGRATRGTMRRLSHFGVGIYKRDRDALLRSGAIDVIGENTFVLLDQGRYSEEVGLDLGETTGEAMFL